ncbi:hypothetical protein OG410_40960 [Streptomyces sp. NBC_00659]|uniref:VOC family protein n=1 Tax=Streptomyces sp. NBC_00659 TaxID=2903669 RepID=UPI002E32C301|nr:VOC family protein [Streptomyces sp. NBC_00659]
MPQHFHLDFGAPNLDEAEEKALALGATKVAVQLSEPFPTWAVERRGGLRDGDRT